MTAQHRELKQDAALMVTHSHDDIDDDKTSTHDDSGSSIVLDADGCFTVDGVTYAPQVVTVGEVEVGDYVQGSEGPVRVAQLFDVHVPESMYELENEDGETIQVSGDHLIYVETAEDLATFNEHAKRVYDVWRSNEYFRNVVRNILSESVKRERWESIPVDFKGVVRILAENHIELTSSEQFLSDVRRICEAVGPVCESTYTKPDESDPTGATSTTHTVVEYSIEMICKQIDDIVESVRVPTFKERLKLIVGVRPKTVRVVEPLKGRVMTVKHLVEEVGLENATLPDLAFKTDAADTTADDAEINTRESAACENTEREGES